MSDSKTISKRIGARVRSLRTEREYTIKDLAKRTGMHRPIISRVELGTYMPRLDTLLRFSQALDCKLVDLLQDVEDPIEKGDGDGFSSGTENRRDLPSPT